jgi:hypothetical protein
VTRGLDVPSMTTSSLGVMTTAAPLAGVTVAWPPRRVMNAVRSPVTSTR